MRPAGLFHHAHDISRSLLPPPEEEIAWLWRMQKAKPFAFSITMLLFLPSKTADGSNDLAVSGKSRTLEIGLEDALLDARIHGGVDVEGVQDIVEGQVMPHGKR